MICPYCGKEMRYGVIQSQHEISWKPKKGKFFATAQFSKEAIILSEFSFLKGSCVCIFRAHPDTDSDNMRTAFRNYPDSVTAHPDTLSIY
jgi:hypothetical protein